jgi:hypothetical protein
MPGARHRRLTSTEKKLREACDRGEVLDLRTADSQAARIAGGRKWGDDRTVRASVLKDVVVRSGEPLRLKGARVLGVLDLAETELKAALDLEGCFFEDNVVLSSVNGTVVRLRGCHVPVLDATRTGSLSTLGVRE